jgi:hypothetical protein
MQRQKKLQPFSLVKWVSFKDTLYSLVSLHHSIILSVIDVSYIWNSWHTLKLINAMKVEAFKELGFKTLPSFNAGWQGLLSLHYLGQIKYVSNKIKNHTEQN